eukprot:501793-Rhodomonas_salina.4
MANSGLCNPRPWISAMAISGRAPASHVPRYTCKAPPRRFAWHPRAAQPFAVAGIQSHFPRNSYF